MKAKNRCPECGSLMCYYRVKTDNFLCQKCGHIWIKKDPKKEAN